MKRSQTYFFNILLSDVSCFLPLNSEVHLIHWYALLYAFILTLWPASTSMLESGIGSGPGLSVAVPPIMQRSYPPPGGTPGSYDSLTRKEKVRAYDNVVNGWIVSLLFFLSYLFEHFILGFSLWLFFFLTFFLGSWIV